MLSRGRLPSGVVQGGVGATALVTTAVVMVVREGGGGEEFVPADNNVGQVEVVKQDLSHTHERFPIHSSVVAPHGHLRRNSNLMQKRKI